MGIKVDDLIIDDETHWVGNDNRYRTNTPKTQILIATSMRKGDNLIKRLKHKDFGKTKSWNTYTITREGKVFQHYDPSKHTDFLDMKKGDKQIISVVLENMGYLVKSEDNKYINWIGEVCDEGLIVDKLWMGYKKWEKIPDEQLLACGKLCKMIADEYGIIKKVIDFRHYHKEISRYRGIVFRSNYIEDSSDITPLINIGELKLLIGDNNEE